MPSPRNLALVTTALAVVALLVPRTAHAQSGAQETYVRIMASHFQVSESEAELLAAESTGPEHLPVLLLLARESGLAPPAVLAYRRGGQSWMAIVRRLGVPLSRFQSDLDPADAGPDLARAVRLLRETPPAQSSGLDLSDAELAGLVHVAVLSRYFQVAPVRVIEARARVNGWLQVPAELGGP